MSPEALPLLDVSPADPGELGAAFRLIFRGSRGEDVEARVANALNLIRQGEFDPAGVLVARGPRGVLGAVVCHLGPGASGLIWPPQVDAGDRTRVEDALVRRAVGWLRSQGAKLGQSLLEPADAPLAEPLLRHGFRLITNLWYMRHTLTPLPRRGGRDGGLTFRTYRRCDPLAFRETLVRTYDGSADCPEVNGVRTIEEVIAGHLAQGRFDPDRWWLVTESHQPVGVLLVAEVPDWHGWDLAYLGVVPEARRHGIGRAMTAHALWEAAEARQVQMTLSVDARNHAAWQMYQALGFQAFDQRAVYLAVWGAEG